MKSHQLFVPRKKKAVSGEKNIARKYNYPSGFALSLQVSPAYAHLWQSLSWAEFSKNINICIGNRFISVLQEQRKTRAAEAEFAEKRNAPVLIWPFSTCPLCFTAPKDGVSEHTVWFPLGSLPLLAVDGHTEQKTKQLEMPLGQRNTDPPGHRHICVAGAEVVQPRRCAPNLRVLHRHDTRTMPALLIFTSTGEVRLLRAPQPPSPTAVRRKSFLMTVFSWNVALASIYSH